MHGGREPRERPRHALQRQRELDNAAPIDGPADLTFIDPRPFRDYREAGLLHRMISMLIPGGSPTRRLCPCQHRGVLARAVVMEPRCAGPRFANQLLAARREAIVL